MTRLPPRWAAARIECDAGARLTAPGSRGEEVREMWDASLRRTGRTTRILREALAAAEREGCAYIIARDPGQVSELAALVVRMRL